MPFLTPKGPDQEIAKCANARSIEISFIRFAAGPDARAELELEAAPSDEAEDEPPRQQALALEVTDSPGPFGRGGEDAPPAPLLSGDWAAAVPPEQRSARTADSPGSRASRAAAGVTPSRRARRPTRSGWWRSS